MGLHTTTGIVAELLVGTAVVKCTWRVVISWAILVQLLFEPTAGGPEPYLYQSLAPKSFTCDNGT